MKKREEMKIHVWEKHTENNYFLHFSHMNLVQTNVFVCFHILSRKIHILGQEVLYILVSFFQIAGEPLAAQTSLYLKDKTCILSYMKGGEMQAPLYFAHSYR